MQKAKSYKKKPILVSAEGFLVLMDKKSPKSDEKGSGDKIIEVNDQIKNLD